MVLKGFEYAQDFEERYVPGPIFRQEYAAASAAIAGMTKEQRRSTFKAQTR